MPKKAVKVELSEDHYQLLARIKEKLGLESDAEAVRSAIRLAYDFLKRQGLIEEK